MQPGADQPRRSHSGQVSRVVVIGVDGMSPDGIRNADTPVLDKLMRDGAYTLNARGVLPTSSSSNWKSMVSGAGPEQHGVTSNGWEHDDHSLPAVAHGMEQMFPTIFGQLRLQRPTARIGAFYAWDGFGRLIERSALNQSLAGKDDHTTVSAAAAYLVAEQPDLLFVHLDHLDHIGHTKGHKTAQYYAAVEQVDREIGALIDAAAAAGLADSTVFIVTSDHGGIGYGHGGETLDEIEIPFIVYGATVKPGHPIGQFVYTYDTALTVSHLLGVTPHPAWIGKPITNAFIGESGVDTNVLTRRSTVQLPAPVLYPRPHLYAPAGGLFIDQPAKVEMSTETTDAQIRYTIDGSDPQVTSALYEGPLQLTRSAVVKARAFVDDAGGNVATGFYRVVESRSSNGIAFEYFEGDNWHFVPAFDALSPTKTGRTYQFRIDDIPLRKHGFGVRFTAWLDVERAGVHKFYTNSDDGSKLYVNGEEVVNNDGAHGAIERSGTIELAAGLHEIRLDYFNEAGGAWLDVYHKPPGSPKQLIDPAKLYPQRPE